jgi:hypothetical protein
VARAQARDAELIAAQSRDATPHAAS